jgi:ADP-heptose:LPS heptosyltransferase
MDGLGDVLMLIPSLKVWAKKGYLIDVSTKFPAALENLSYINNVFKYGEPIKNISQYDEYFNLSFRLSNYNQEYCRQHRVLATAHLCQVKPEELESQRPEIILTDDEKLWSTQVLPEPEKKIAIIFTSADNTREYPREKRQELISGIKAQFPDHLLVLVGDKVGDGDWQIKQPCPWKKLIYKNCIDARGKTGIRGLFAVINRCDYCVTVDTSALHVAAAFKKPTVFLPSSVQAEWRIYEGMRAITPPVGCYPCNQRNEGCLNKIQAGWCVGLITSDKVCEQLNILMGIQGA